MRNTILKQLLSYAKKHGSNVNRCIKLVYEKKNPKESVKERIKEGGKYVWQPESKQQGVDLNPTI